MASDVKTLTESAVKQIMDEVPALRQLKLVIGLELRGRGDIQLYRVQLPGPEVVKDSAGDARVRVALPRASFNELASEGTIRDWRRAFETGVVRAEGPSEILKLIVNVVERSEERARTRKVRRP